MDVAGALAAPDAAPPNAPNDNGVEAGALPGVANAKEGSVDAADEAPRGKGVLTARANGAAEAVLNGALAEALAALPGSWKLPKPDGTADDEGPNPNDGAELGVPAEQRLFVSQDVLVS